MRTFIAIPLPAECRAMLEQLQRKLQAFRADVRWVSVRSIHLTLKFLGEVDPKMIPQLAEALKNAVTSQQTIALRLHGLGSFPNLRNPRVLWCGIDGETTQLAQLQHQIELACESFGFAAEERSFAPHLTLGRVQGKSNLQPLLDYIKMGSDLEARFHADCFHIYKSTLKPQGAEYSVLSTILINSNKS
jgi:RNA 2',3'-cyclic 3'-phosphodiesterase